MFETAVLDQSDLISTWPLEHLLELQVQAAQLAVITIPKDLSQPVAQILRQSRVVTIVFVTEGQIIIVFFVEEHAMFRLHRSTTANRLIELTLEALHQLEISIHQ